MENAEFKKLVEDLEEYNGVEEVFLLSPKGEILFKSKDFPFSDQEAKDLLKSWREKEGSINFQGYRFAILKNDELQLAAKNISQGKGNIVGSKTKDGDYVVAHISKDTGLILLEWSIYINKVAWK
ncbi:MAG: hypothetical protein P8Y70_03915 [Candidatus Lokiarchaeota archaeon]